MRIIVILLIVLISFSLSAAPVGVVGVHSPKMGFKDAEGFGGLQVSVYHAAMGSVNAHLKSAGYGTIDSTFMTIGGGGYGIIKNRTIVGGSGFFIFPNKSESVNATAEVKGGYGFFEVGYGIISTDKFKMFPMLGIGGGSMKMNLMPRYSGSPNFQDILNDPQRMTELSSASFAIQVAMQQLFIFKEWEEEEDGETHLVKVGGALKFGVIYNFNNDWKMDGINVMSSPKIPKERYFAGLSIMFGGKRVK